eukprot:CAMPEP_0194355904 /NCGR_PEP_ID=MMETSP0174-20130528/3746_1 /TAXON_ID=216777 /ORGANISM="Proboscia alata, Strain PI-D3" /LENGTH=1089 /DNA_ID=CAMNT_0039125369 /DNA_START=40 /DNA_END=3309 /DNA_ORIENTATION=+
MTVATPAHIVANDQFVDDDMALCLDPTLEEYTNLLKRSTSYGTTGSIDDYDLGDLLLSNDWDVNDSSAVDVIPGAADVTAVESYYPQAANNECFNKNIFQDGTTIDCDTVQWHDNVVPQQRPLPRTRKIPALIPNAKVHVGTDVSSLEKRLAEIDETLELALKRHNIIPDDSSSEAKTDLDESSSRVRRAQRLLKLRNSRGNIDVTAVANQLVESIQQQGGILKSVDELLLRNVPLTLGESAMMPRQIPRQIPPLSNGFLSAAPALTPDVIMSEPLCFARKNHHHGPTPQYKIQAQQNGIVLDNRKKNTSLKPQTPPSISVAVTKKNSNKSKSKKNDEDKSASSPSNNSTRETNTNMNNIDLDTITIEEYLALQGETLPEGDDAESKKQRRLIRNRLSAQLHREKKRCMISTLKTKVQTRDETIEDLKQKLHMALSETSSLKTRIEQLERHSQVSFTARGNISPPHLVGSSGSSTNGCLSSEESCLTSDDDDTVCVGSTPGSPPLSPIHEAFGYRDGSSLANNTSNELPSSTQNSLPFAVSGNKRKAIIAAADNGSFLRLSNKRAPKGKNSTNGSKFVVAGMMAFATLLGLVVVKPTRNVVTSQEDLQDNNLDIDHRRLQDFVNDTVDEKQIMFMLNDLAARKDILLPKSDEGEMSIGSHVDQVLRSLVDSDSTADGTPSNPIPGSAENLQSKNDASFMISPLEMYPSLWTVRHEDEFSSPWEVRNSHQLFDFRSPSTSRSTLSKLVSFRDAPRCGSKSSKCRFDIARLPSTPGTLDYGGRRMKITRVTGNNTEPESFVEASAMNDTSNTRTSLRGAKKVKKTLLVDEKEMSKNGVLSQNTTEREAVRIAIDNALHKRKNKIHNSNIGKSTGETKDHQKTDGDSDDRDDNANTTPPVVIGSSFIFAPSAFASLSPGFLELSGLDNTARESTDSMIFDNDDGENSQKGAWAQMHTSQFDVDSDADDNGFDEIFSAPTPQPSDLLPMDLDESKALVPAHWDSTRKRFVGSSSRLDNGNDSTRGPFMQAILGGDDPYMSILVPASSLMGGSVFSEGYGGLDKPFIELGCHVLSARVVDGVNFVGDGSSRNRQ